MLMQAALWTAFAGCIGGFTWEEIKKRKGSRIVVEVDEKELKRDFTTPYTKLFENIGLMDTEKNDWIKCYGIEDHDCYRVITFKISDTLSYKDFQKKAGVIAEKLQVPEQHIEIYSEKGYMKFRIRHLELKPVPYHFKKTPSNIVPLGVDLDNHQTQWDIKSDPHLVIIGTTGSGKSTLLHMILNHIMLNQDGGELYLIDLKKGLELGAYKNTKGCRGYAEDIEEAKSVIAEFSAEADRRYDVMKDKGYNNYNKFIDEYPGEFKRAYLVVDEFADLMTRKKPKNGEFDVIEELIQLARKVRAVGMSLILSTQRPTADSIPPTLKANTSIICFRVINQLNSQVALDEGGAEFLDPRHCIAILNGKKTYFRTMFFSGEDTEKTCEKYRRRIVKKTEPIERSVVPDGVELIKK